MAKQYCSYECVYSKSRQQEDNFITNHKKRDIPITRKETNRVIPSEGYGESHIIPATQEERQQATLQDLFSLQPHDLPLSNQQSWSNAETSSPTGDLQEESHSLGLLTQYLGSSGSSTQTRCKSNPEDVIEKQTEDFKKYLEFTELLDWANSHLESLLQAKSKARTPTRLQITTKPVVVHSEDEELKIKWAQPCRQGKLLLIEVLLNHLRILE